MQEQQNLNDEIDLLDLLRKVVFFIKKYFLMFIVAFLLGGFVGFIYLFTEKPKYKSNLVGISGILNTEDVGSMTEKCSKLIEDGNIQDLSKILGIDSAEAVNIVSLKVTSELLPKKGKQDDQVIANKFNFEVVSYDYNLFVKLNKAIPDMIRYNKYTKLKTDLILYTKENVYKKLEKEIRLLDSLKKNITPGITAGKSTFYVANPSSINESIMKLYEQQMSMYEILNTRQDFLVIEDFAMLKTPFNKKMGSFIKYILLFGGVFLMLSFMYAVGKEAMLLVNKI